MFIFEVRQQNACTKDSKEDVTKRLKNKRKDGRSTETQEKVLVVKVNIWSN